MKPSLLDTICCPLCRQKLTLDQRESDGERVWEGVLQCERCHVDYPLHKGIPYLMSEAGWGESKAPEIKGWTSLWQKKGMYGHDGHLQNCFAVPYIGGICEPTALWFDRALAELDLRCTISAASTAS